jgi:3-methyladenine DNA glycosylase AlkC
MITKTADVKPLIARGKVAPEDIFAEVRRLAASPEWQTREVAATVMVEVAKRHPAAIVAQSAEWASDPDANVRRAASEGLRGLVKRDPAKVWPVLEQLRKDPDIYVKKSVANVLRNASAAYPEAVLALCRRWATTADSHTCWIIKDGLRKLRILRPADAADVLQMLTPKA